MNSSGSPFPMFPAIRKARLAAAFFHERSADYVQLAHLDFLEFREELIKVTLSVGIFAVAGMLFIAFLSLAIIITAWDSSYRVIAAWAVCGGWAVLCFAAAAYGKATLDGPKPFIRLARMLIDDITAVRTHP